MTNGSTVRYAVVGYGLAGSAFHAPIIAATQGASLAAVVARGDTAAAAVRERYPGTTVVPDIADLPPLGIDVGVIATPNATHAELAATLIDSGIAVVVDKPLAESARSARELVERARAAGVALTCYQNRRWDGDFLTLLSLDAAGTFGDLHRFESRFERWRPEVRSGWKETPGPAAGVLWDLGPHVIDQAIVLGGPVDSVAGTVRTLRPGAEVPDDATVVLTHSTGIRSHLSVSLVAAAPGPRFRVLGTQAAFVKDGLDPQEDELRAGVTPGGPGWGEEARSHWGVLTSLQGGRQIHPTLSGDYPQFYRMMTDHMLGRGPLPVDPRDSVRVLEIIEEVS